MRSMMFRSAVLFSMLLVVSPEIVPVFELAAAEAAPRRGRRASRAQTNRARAARAKQNRRVQAQRAQAASRARAQAAARARMNAMARLNQAQANAANTLAARLKNSGNIPVIVNKDYRLAVDEQVSVSSVTPIGKKPTFENIGVGQTVTVTVIREKEEGKPQPAASQLTGRIIRVDSNSTKEVTVRVSAYQYGAKNGDTTTVAPAPGQSVSAIVIRSQAQGAAGLFKP